MSDLGDFKRRVYEPEVAALKELAWGIALGISAYRLCVLYARLLERVADGGES